MIMSHHHCIFSVITSSKIWLNFVQMFKFWKHQKWTYRVFRYALPQISTVNISSRRHQHKIFIIISLDIYPVCCLLCFLRIVISCCMAAMYLTCRMQLVRLKRRQNHCCNLYFSTIVKFMNVSFFYYWPWGHLTSSFL